MGGEARRGGPRGAGDVRHAAAQKASVEAVVSLRVELEAAQAEVASLKESASGDAASLAVLQGKLAEAGLMNEKFDFSKLSARGYRDRRSGTYIAPDADAKELGRLAQIFSAANQPAGEEPRGALDRLLGQAAVSRPGAACCNVTRTGHNAGRRFDAPLCAEAHHAYRCSRGGG